MSLFPCLLLRCKGASHYGLTKERKRRSQDCSPDHGSSLAVAALGPELSAAAAIALMTDEPGLVNPAFSPTSEDSQLGSSPGDLHRSNRNRSKNQNWRLQSPLAPFNIHLSVKYVSLQD